MLAIISSKLLSVPHRRQALLLRWRSTALVECLQEALGYSSSELRNARYNSRKQRIVTDHFPYKPRTAQEQQVADWLQRRFKERAEFEKNLEGDLGNDKQFNPIIAVTGAPGMGKSSFLAHLPESAAFQAYHELTGAASPPIVAALSFNGVTTTEPEDKSHDLGMRVLYGAYRSMGGPRSLPALDWHAFKRTFSAAHPESIHARDAVLALREVFGPERRVLLLVDEVSKAKMGQPGWDVQALQQLGGVLDGYSWVDAVVSSLSAPYIKNLVTTASQRPVEYLALPLLLEEMEGAERLGGKEANECAVNVFNAANAKVSSSSKAVKVNVSSSKAAKVTVSSSKAVKVNVSSSKAAKVDVSSSRWTHNLLCNLPLLTSGHPRSLQNLVKAQRLVEGTNQLPPCWNKVVEDVGSRKGVGEVLFTLAEKVIHTQCDYNLDDVYFPKVLPLVLSCRALNPMSGTEEGVLVRELVESGQIYIVPSDEGELRAAIRFDNFVSLARWAKTQKRPDEYVRALAVLLGKDVVDVEKTRVNKSAPEDPRDDKTTNNLTVLWHVVDAEKTRANNSAPEDPRNDKTINNLTVLWERVVALTVVGRSLGETGSVLGQGVSRFEEDTPALSAVIAKNASDLEMLHPNTLTITPHKHPGNDAQVLVRRDPSSDSFDELAAYLQFKIEISLKKRTLEGILAKIVVYSLRDHLQRQCTQHIPLNNVFVVLYVWDTLPPTNAKTLKKEVDKLLINARKQNKPGEEPGELFSMSNEAYEALCLAANEFVTNHGANIHLMDKTKLDDWLIPSLRPIPRLVQAISPRE